MTATIHQPRILAMWMVLNILDALLTGYLLSNGGVEGNPLLAAMQGQLGTVGMLGAKVALAGIVGLAIWRAERRPLLLTADVGMGLVVVYNAFILALMR